MNSTHQTGLVGDGSSRYYIKGGSFQINTWHHLVYTYDGSTALLHVDGSEVSSNNINITPDKESINVPIARQRYADQRYFTGSISDTRLYNRAITESEAQSLYEWRSGDFTDQPLHDGSDNGVASRYTFDRDVNDSWGNYDGDNNTSAKFSDNSVIGKSKIFDGSDDSVRINPAPSSLNAPITVAG